MVIFFVAISCQKEQTRTNPVQNHYKLVSSNPLEFMGISHNNAMDYIAQDLHFPDLTPYELYSISCSYEDQYFDSTTPSQTEYDNLMDQLSDLLEAGKDAPNLIYQDGDINYLTKLRLDTLFAIIYEGYEHNDLENPDVMDSLIYAYEEKYIDLTKSPGYYLNEHNLDGIILGTCVISRHSYRYWYEAVYEENPWTSYLEENGGLDCPNFWKRLWADIKGFVGNCGEPHDANCMPDYSYPYDHWSWDPVCAWNKAKGDSGAAKGAE
jgi:hypothetical protein